MACPNHPGVAHPLVRCAGCLQSLCRACVEPHEQFFYCASCHPLVPAASATSKAPPVSGAPPRSAASAPATTKAAAFEPTVPTGAPSPAPGAPFLRRALALVVDVIVIGLVLRFLLAGVSDEMGVLALMFVVPTVYEAAFLQHMGQTLGKALLGVQVVSHDGSLVGGAQAVGRSVLKVVQFTCCGLTLLSVFVSKERRALHDLAAGTRVVRAGERAAVEADD
jgi:uncharacterized RDD family membrane protein YckC